MKSFQNSERTQKADEDAMSDTPSTQNSGAMSRSRETKTSKRSLRALEKQATDLYDFLSELEVKKSAGPEKLREFLDSTEGKPVQYNKSPTSRLKNGALSSKLSRNEAEKSPPAVAKRSEAAKTPMPPVRKDSVKRLENARSKYLSVAPKKSDLDTSQDGTALSPSNEKSPSQKPLKSSSEAINVQPTKKEGSEKQIEASTTAELKRFDTDRDATPKKVAESEITQKSEIEAETPKSEIRHSITKSKRHRSTTKLSAKHSSTVNSSEYRRSAADSSEKVDTATVTASTSENQHPEDKPSETHRSTAEPTHNSTPKSIETPKEPPTRRTRARRNDKSRDTTVKNLNEKLMETPKPHRTEAAPKVSSIDDRLKSYQSRASRQESTKKSVAAKPASGDLVNRLNMWESGKVTAGGKTAKKNVDTALVKQSKGVSSRKNMWETGAVTGSAEKKAARSGGEPHGVNLASRKNLWLKATQEPAEKSLSKPEDKAAIRVGVSTRLDKWEKGDLKTASEKPKIKDSAVVASDVTNRRSKWETKAHESSTRSVRKTRPEISRSTDIAARKNKYESKTEQAADKTAINRETTRKSVSSQSDSNQRDSDLDSMEADEA